MKIDIYNTDKKYQVIYADPPWSYRQKGNARGTAVAHYDTMDTDDICNLPVKDIKTDDAILFMWATFPNLYDALKVINAWEFEYKTAAFVWVKTNKKSDGFFWGMGAYTRANAENCLVATSKKTRAKEQIKRHDIHQIVMSPIEEHSKKPDVIRDNIMLLTGEKTNKIELFARQYSCGWDCWGNEV